MTLSTTSLTSRVLLAGACIAALVFGSLDASAQEKLAPRVPGAKQSLEKLRQMPASRKVVMKLKEGRTIRFRAGRFEGLEAGDVAAMMQVLSSFGITVSAIKRMHVRDEAELDAERRAAESESGEKLADLNLYFVITLPDRVQAAELADRLNRLAPVEFAEPVAIPAPPPFDIAPATPNLKSEQGYLKKAPGGIGVLQKSRYQGAWGKNLNVGDVEYSWQIDHEDLEFTSAQIFTGAETALDPFNDSNHGTAVMGEISARNNGYGVTGIAPDAKVMLFPANTSQSGYSPARAIGVATGKMRRGDVMVIEQQYWACGASTSSSTYGPVEELQDVFDAIKTATAKGIIVVEAAGNGNINLDGASCNSKYDRTVRDSGAIIVGAGSTTGAKLSFSSFGSRVDVHGWGENVVTTGYGDRFFPGSDARQKYTSTFSGTSSATPIVSGAALQVNGVIKACGFKPLTSKQMRSVLAATGTPQTDPLNGKIGPLPNIPAAIRKTDARACFNAQ